MNTLSKEFEEQFNFLLQKHKWRLDSNSDILFSLVLNNNTGIKYFSNGDSMFITDNTSSEVVGYKSPENGGIPPNSGIPAKIIHAANGDIVLDALQGDIILRGMNIRIEGVDGLGGEVTINSSKTIQMDAPNIKVQSQGNITMSAASSFSAAGGSLMSHGEYTNETTAGTDFLKASFFGKILSAIQKFKDFFNSKCG